MRVKTPEQIALLEAKVKRAKAERIAAEDKQVWRALRIADLADELTLELEEADEGGQLARVLQESAYKLLEKLGAPR